MMPAKLTLRILRGHNTQPQTLPHDAISRFGLTICGTSCYGNNWVISCPEKTYEYTTELGSSIYNVICKEYLALINSEARRNIHDVAREMGLVERIHSRGARDEQGISVGYKRAIARLGCNVFDPDNDYPAFPFTSPKQDISFLRLVFDIKCHLISNAIQELCIRGHRRYFPFTWARLSPHLLHNIMIKNYVERYVKYQDKGITIEGLCNLQMYKDSGVVHVVESVSTLSRGASDTFGMSNYYYPDNLYPEESSFDNSDSEWLDDEDSDEDSSDRENLERVIEICDNV
jgi:hypothetical protein